MDDNNKIKIVMILSKDFLYPHLDPRVYKEAKSLIKNKFDVSIINRINTNRNEKIFESIKIIDIFEKKINNKSNIFFQLINYIGFNIHSLKILLNLESDIIHCHDLDTLGIGVLFKLIKGTPVIFDAHEDYPALWLNMHKNQKLISIFLRIYEKFLLKFTDKVIAAEELYTKNMLKYYKTKPTIIKNYPSEFFFNQQFKDDDLIKKYSLNNKFIIIQMGAISKNRAVFEILDAFKLIKYDNIRLFLIGNVTNEVLRSLKNKINDLKINDKIIIIPKGIKFEDTPKYYFISHLSIALLYPLPNYITSIPTKLYESIAIGTPVIAADFPHIKKIIDGHEVGICVNSLDPSDIARKINILIKNEELRKKMSKNGREISKKLYNWEISEKLLINLYVELNKHYKHQIK